MVELLEGMRRDDADLGVADCYYSPAHFATRPRLWEIVRITMEARTALNRLLGGFPEGKGFAVRRETYERVGGIEILYQMKRGQFLAHPSDDLDFGVRVVAHGGKVVFCEQSRVEIDPRRVNEQLDDMVAGCSYGSNGVFEMEDVRPAATAKPLRDIAEAEGGSLWGYSLKDVVIRGVLLPLLLDCVPFRAPGRTRRSLRRMRRCARAPDQGAARRGASHRLHADSLLQDAVLPPLLRVRGAHLRASRGSSYRGPPRQDASEPIIRQRVQGCEGLVSIRCEQERA
ncbi:MAG TPA: hypothetical protein VNA69_17165 [Thermoanaerobaculia bacterium]|nr:hypothetical protein [Thermoanaerobaculia bacterium]